MKTQLIRFIVTGVTILNFPFINFAQSPNLGTAANFVLFTATGALDNTGTSQITGNIGTNNGAITGFEAPTSINGNIDSGNAVTMQCATDVQAAYNQLYNTAATSTSHSPAFGSGETLFAGVYEISAAGSAGGNLTLDAQGNPNAVFIFKFGGAFTTGASTTITLSNGALACNVYWAAEGAIAMAAVTEMKGTLIANNGAISMGDGGILEGRMLSTTGAASFYNVLASIPVCSILPIELISFTGNCDKQNVLLYWSTASETNNNYFTVERSVEGINWQVVGTVAGAGNSSSQHTYTLTDRIFYMKPTFYRLKQTDFNGNYKYGTVIAIKTCNDMAVDNFTVYPNPSAGKFELLPISDGSKVNSIEIYNSQGQKLYESIGFHSKFDLSNNAPGLYYMNVQQNLKTITFKIIVKK